MGRKLDAPKIGVGYRHIAISFKESYKMLGEDLILREKIMGLWEISSQPLTFSIGSNRMIVRASKLPLTHPPLLDLPMTIFLALEPVEIVEQIDKQNKTSTLRKEFKGFKKNPFSSQN